MNTTKLPRITTPLGTAYQGVSAVAKLSNGIHVAIMAGTTEDLQSALDYMFPIATFNPNKFSRTLLTEDTSPQ